MHIIRWPISLKRVAGSPAPRRATRVAQNSSVWPSLRRRDPLLAKEARSGAPGFCFEFVAERLFADIFNRFTNSTAEATQVTSVSCGYGSGLRVLLQFCGHGNADRRGGVWHQSQNSSSENDPHTHPNPHHQWIQVRSKNRATVILIHSLKYEIEILVEGGADEGHRRSLLAGMVEAALGRHRINLLATFVHVKNRPLAEIVGIVVFGGGAADQSIGADGQLVAAVHLHFFVLIKRGSREANDDHDDAKVHDVTAIASRIA